MVEKTDNMPIWVFLAFSSIGTRKGALILVWVCAAFAIYCLPWSLFFSDQDWVAGIFLIKDWSWFGMMVPVLAWYLISLRWLDQNNGWSVAEAHNG